MQKVGDRVGAILGGKDGVVKFLGWGVYVGDEVPPADVGGFNFGQSNPKITLDNGDTVWGCECWWGSVEGIQRWLDSAKEVVTVSISDARQQAGE
jgi:hypothetical protein